jgi:hypothetical protein
VEGIRVDATSRKTKLNPWALSAWIERSKMKQRVMWFGVLLLALAALPLAGGVSGSKARPFKANSIVYVTEDRGADYDADMYGEATHLGKFEGQFLKVQFLPDGPAGPANVGSGKLTAANGDKVNLDMVDYLVYLDEFIAICDGTYVIQGGSGRFLNASGHESYVGIVYFSNFNPPEFTFEGTIVY